jgi:ADP-heptose:LPS heptosyltransferase
VIRRLIIRPGAIGDFILSLPAMESLRTGFLEVWGASANIPLVRFADRTRAIAATGLDLLGISGPDERLITCLRTFSSIVSWYGANRPEFRALTRELRLPFEFLTALPPPASEIHAADYYLRQAASLGGVPVPAVPRIPVPRRERDGCVIHPFSGSPRKNWPLDRYRALADRLGALLPVEWCAGPEDDLPGAFQLPDLYDLACRLAGARLFIGNDSGITHLAAALGTPVVALFGSTDPAIWAPRGENVVVLRGGGMPEIGVEEVLAAAASLIK